MKITGLILSLWSLLPLAGLLAQGPLDGYLKGKGVLDLAPSFSFNSAKNFAGAGGRSYPLSYKGNMISLFGEYGLGRKLDVVGTAAYVFTSNRSGLQDGGLFVKYRPLYREIPGAGRLGLLLGSGLSFPLTRYEPALTGALGQRAVIAPLRLIVQWETPPGLFLNVTGGYNRRFDRLRDADVARIRKERPDYQPVDPADFSTLLVKIGLPAARFYTDAWIEWQWTAFGADYEPGVPDLPQAYGVAYTQIGGTFFYSENGKNGAYLSGGYILGGRNTGRLLRLTLGMVLKIGQKA